MIAKLPKNAVKITHQPAENIKPKDAQNKMGIKNATDLEQAYPELAAQIRNSADEAAYSRGIQAEREAAITAVANELNRLRVFK